ncbi:MAG: hypothetical protein HY819_08185 [Acidobacteria bacterium]|nr:hypothetical protein [Acidobacteriota bacterium]
MRLSKYSLFAILLLFGLVLPICAQQRPRGGMPTGAGRNEAERRSIAEQQRELRVIEMMGNNPNEEVDPIVVRQLRIKKDMTELNEATLAFLQIVKNEAHIVTDRVEAKEIAKMADKVAKCSKRLREDLALEDFKVTINPLERSSNDTRSQYLVKLAENIDQLIEQINISQATRSASEVKLKVLARHLTALETHATSAKDVAKNKD